MIVPGLLPLFLYNLTATYGRARRRGGDLRGIRVFIFNNGAALHEEARKSM